MRDSALSSYQNAPIISIPIKAIGEISNPDPKGFEKSNHRNKDAEKNLYNNMFEVKLKYKYEDLYRFREIDKISNSSVGSSPSRSMISNKSPLGSVRTSAQRISKLRNSANMLPLAQKLSGLNSAGNSRNTSRNVTNTYNNYEVVVEGHLMPKYTQVRPGSSQAIVSRFTSQGSKKGTTLKTIDSIKKLKPKK